VVHELEHLAEAFAALTHELGRRAVEGDGDRGRAVMAELFFDAIERGESNPLPALVAVGGREKQRQPGEPAAPVVVVGGGGLGAGDDEVVFAVPGSDEDLLPGDRPRTARVLGGGAAQRGHVASRVGSVMSMLPHARPSAISAISRRQRVPTMLPPPSSSVEPSRSENMSIAIAVPAWKP